MKGKGQAHNKETTVVLTVRIPATMMQRLDDILQNELHGYRYASRTHLVQCALREWLSTRNG